jgi:hypothetical protein
MHLRLDQQEDPAALTINTELESGTMMRAFRSRWGQAAHVFGCGKGDFVGLSTP